MQASSNDLVFALPTGYIEQRNGEVIWRWCSRPDRVRCTWSGASATATGGRFTFQDGELTLPPDHRPASAEKNPLACRSGAWLFDVSIEAGATGTNRRHKHACNGDCESNQGV